jgi:hypothetical protein
MPEQHVKNNVLSLQERPYFCWDRSWSVGDIKAKLAKCTPEDWPMLAAWIMREARFEDVWVFLQPAEIAAHFGELKSLLGRKREFWKYILGVWHELGKI